MKTNLILMLDALGMFPSCLYDRWREMRGFTIQNTRQLCESMEDERVEKRNKRISAIALIGYTVGMVPSLIFLTSVLGLFTSDTHRTTIEVMRGTQLETDMMSIWSVFMMFTIVTGLMSLIAVMVNLVLANTASKNEVAELFVSDITELSKTLKLNFGQMHYAGMDDLITLSNKALYKQAQTIKTEERIVGTLSDGAECARTSFRKMHTIFRAFALVEGELDKYFIKDSPRKIPAYEVAV